jgi:hypothetical protein
MSHRTALITAGSIAAVVFAGAIAIGVNLGILTFADSRPVGKLSASSVPQTAAPPVAREAVVSKASPNTPTTQVYVIKKAGTVTIAFSRAGVRVVDVSAKPHWKWALTQSNDRSLTVTFRSGSTVDTFVASLGRQGTVVARVDQPVTRVVRAAPARWVAAPTRAVAPARAVASTARSAPSGGDGSDSHGGSSADD